jgi:hypothetical protein
LVALAQPREVVGDGPVDVGGGLIAGVLAESARVPGERQIVCRITPSTWRTQIDAAIRRVSQFQSAVYLSSALPHLIDWGNGRRALASARRALVE